MSLAPDPQAVRDLATRVRVVADDLQSTADSHVRNGWSAQWQSTAANEFRDGLLGDRTRANTTVDDLRETADRLERLADTVEERLAALARAAAAAAEAAEDMVDTLADGAEAVVDGVSTAATAVASFSNAAVDAVTNVASTVFRSLR